MPTTEERTLTDLLDEWADLEPDRCRVLSTMYLVRLEEDTEWKVAYPHRVQCVVQEVIEERGWRWYAGQSHPRGPAEYFASIDFDWTSQPDLTSRRDDSATHAMLEVYLAALRTHD